MKINFSLMTIFVLSCTMTKAQIKADDVIGNWLTAGNEPAKIQMYKSEGKFYGKIIWLKNATDNGKPKVDINNPDKTKRNNLLIGLVILMAFKFDGDDEWKGGNIYDPETGKTYSSYFYLKENTLKVRGYIGTSLFGRNETWTRIN